jgi:hypothetical protein
MAKRKSIDVRRVIRAAADAALDAALEDPVPPPGRKRRISAGRALLMGAGVMTAGKLAASSRGREVFGTLRDRVEDRLLGSDDDLPEDAVELEEPEDLDAEEPEPHAEAVDDELDEGEEPGEWDDQEPGDDEPELEEPEQPSRKAPTRRRRGRR